MKNKNMVDALAQFAPTLPVSIHVRLKHGCEELGHGHGEWQGKPFSQDYKTMWNDGHLVCETDSGYTVGDVMGVLAGRTIQELSHDDIRMAPGKLMNGTTDYSTEWPDGPPEEAPEDSDLYATMEFGDSEYRWVWPALVVVSVHYNDENGEENTVDFVLADG